jgi:hypothetical protein
VVLAKERVRTTGRSFVMASTSKRDVALLMVGWGGEASERRSDMDYYQQWFG